MLLNYVKKEGENKQNKAHVGVHLDVYESIWIKLGIAMGTIQF